MARLVPRTDSSFKFRPGGASKIDVLTLDFFSWLSITCWMVLTLTHIFFGPYTMFLLLSLGVDGYDIGEIYNDGYD